MEKPKPNCCKELKNQFSKVISNLNKLTSHEKTQEEIDTKTLSDLVINLAIENKNLRFNINKSFNDKYCYDYKAWLDYGSNLEFTDKDLKIIQDLKIIHCLELLNGLGFVQDLEITKDLEITQRKNKKMQKVINHAKILSEVVIELAIKNKNLKKIFDNLRLYVCMFLYI